MNISIATKTEYSDDALTVAVAMLGDGATCAPGEAYHPFGFQGRPKDPDVDPNGEVINGARVLFWYEGSTLHAMPLDDPRRANKLPQVEKGGSLWYADADGAWSRYKADGTLEVRAPAGKTITVQVGSGALVEVSDGAVLIGDAQAVPLAKAQAVIDAIGSLADLISDVNAGLTVPVPTMAASVTALKAAAATLGTMIAKGT